MNEVNPEQFGDLSRLMSAEDGVQLTLERALKIAVDLIDGCDAAGISVVQRRKQVATEVSTSDLARRADQLQHELGEGPALQSVAEQETVSSVDLATETRWPAWSRRVHGELGVRSFLCLQLFVSERSIGALSLYSDRPDAFGADDRPTAVALAAHVAVAMSAAQDKQNLELALANRVVIGQAEGMLMQRYGVSAEQAFSVLVRASQDSNRKLIDVAAKIVAEGLDQALPG